MLLIMIGPTCPSLPRRPPSIDPRPALASFPRITPLIQPRYKTKVKTEITRMHTTHTRANKFPPCCARFEICVTTHVTWSRDYVRDARASLTSAARRVTMAPFD